MTDVLSVPQQNMQGSADSQYDVKSMAPQRNVFRPRSELRLNRISDNLAMSNEEKILKRNYGYNYENNLSLLSKQIS